MRKHEGDTQGGAAGRRGRHPIPRSFLLGVQFQGRGPARNRVVFINSGSGCRKKGPLPESRGAADLALCLQAVRSRQVQGAGSALRRPSSDENLPIFGRSPQFFCHGSSQRGAACAIRLILAARNYGRRYFWFRLLSVPILSSLFSPTSFFKRYVTVLLGIFRPAEISPAPHGSFAETKETISS